MTIDDLFNWFSFLIENSTFFSRVILIPDARQRQQQKKKYAAENFHKLTTEKKGKFIQVHQKLCQETIFRQLLSRICIEWWNGSRDFQV